jgi:hypothetical protein
MVHKKYLVAQSSTPGLVRATAGLHIENDG